MGLCPTCGMQTQQKDQNNNFQPITNDSVLNSRCLLCNPLPKKVSRRISRTKRGSGGRKDDDTASSTAQSTEEPLASSSIYETAPVIFDDDQEDNDEDSGSSSSSDENDSKLASNEGTNAIGANPSSAITPVGPSSVSFAASISSSEIPTATPVSQNQLLEDMLEQQANAQFQEGWNHLMGDHHRSINRKLGQSLIVKAMHDGSLVARGFCHFRGWGELDKDLHASFNCFCIASEKPLTKTKGPDDTNAVFSVNANAVALKGYFYRNGYGTTADFREAVRLLSIAADDGHSWAMAMLAYCFQEEEEFQNDPVLAFQLYKRSAELGYSKAMYNLSELYCIGLGVQEDKREALKWLIKSADLDYEFAKKKMEEEEKGSGSGGRMHVFRRITLGRSSNDRRRRRRSKSRDSKGSRGSRDSEESGRRSRAGSLISQGSTVDGSVGRRSFGSLSSAGSRRSRGSRNSYVSRGSFNDPR